MNHLLEVPVRENHDDPLTLVQHLQEEIDQSIRVGSPTVLRTPVTDLGLQQMFRESGASIRRAVLTSFLPDFDVKITKVMMFAELHIPSTSDKNRMQNMLNSLREESYKRSL
jgi:hypothetical protein